MANDKLPINEDDDLFNFDEMNHAPSRSTGDSPSSATLASPVATRPAAPVVAAPQAPKSIEEPAITPAAPLPASAPRATAAQLPLVKPVMFQEVEAQFARQPETSRIEPQKRRRPGALTVIVLAAAMFINVALVGVVWRSMSDTSAGPEQVGARAANPGVQPATEPTRRSKVWENLEIKPPTSSEGDLVLETAAAEIQHGEYERARMRVYSLLSVIDRFDVGARAGLAARAQVLAADAYREQANAIEHQALISAETAGFIDEPTEKHP